MATAAYYCFYHNGSEVEPRILMFPVGYKEDQKAAAKYMNLLEARYPGESITIRSRIIKDDYITEQLVSSMSKISIVATISVH
jgi:CRISPR/Cas system-associated protein endoribonuclease Cas2